jgi:tRNA (guanine37-N1)-methyltransferase
MNNKNSKCISVPLKDGEKVRKYLKNNNLLRNDLVIKKDNKYIYFPILNKLSNNKIKYRIIEKTFEKKIRTDIHYKERLNKLIPKRIFNCLPSSFDIIGDIILIRLNENLLFYKKDIGNALLATNKNAKVVCLVEPVKGELRTRKLEIIAGEKRTITKHKEYGLIFKVDIKKTYFSPRLANERKRIAKLVNAGDIVVDMFTGVAPFSIMIAKLSNPKIVYALDKNPIAIKYAKTNIKNNKVLDKIQVIDADAKNSCDIIKEKADRIIMNLPFSAYKFFKYALNIANDKCVIHYYDILKEDEINKRIEFLKKTAFEKGFILERLDIHKIKTYAPREFYIGIDITAKKTPM